MKVELVTSFAIRKEPGQEQFWRNRSRTVNSLHE